MLNEQIISSQTDALNYTQTVGYALHLMETLEVNQLPVVDEGRYEGLLSEDDLLDADAGDLLSLFKTDLLPFSVQAHDHFLSAAKMMVGHQLQVVPVIAAGNEFLGTISTHALLRQFAKLNGAEEQGAIIVLAMKHTDYSISQLSRLVETNDAFITQLNTFTNEASGQLVVTLRTNRREVSNVLATFQRYGLEVVYYSGEEQYENELRHNYNHLISFLEM